jgi:diguanylate cyclase (GGDEF)-like protein/PAS domain S-box-containing protein
MFYQPLHRWMSRSWTRIPFQTLLTIPIALQVLGAVGLVSYLSWRSGQTAVNDLANQLMGQVNDRTRDHLKHYTDLPPKITELLTQDLNSNLIRLDGNNLQPLDTYFLNRSRSFPEASFIYVGNEQGKFIGAGPFSRNQPKPQHIIEVADASTQGSYNSYSVGGNNQRAALLESTPNYHPRQRPWYQAGLNAARPTWTSIYPSIGQPNPGLTLTHVRPYFSNGNSTNGKIAGVAAVDFFLSDISSFLQSLPISRSGQIFILEQDDKLVATSNAAPVYQIINQQPQRLSASDHPDPVIRETLQRLKADANLAQSFSSKIAGQQRFVRIAPWQSEDGLNWRIVVVVPESDFNQQIQANTRSTLLLSGLTLLISLGLSYMTSRWASQPIINLSKAAKELAAGHRQQIQSSESQASELGDLTNSFNSMAYRLQHSLSNLKTLNQELFTSKQRLHQLLEALPVGVMVVDPQGKCLYLNRTGQLLLGIRQLPEVSIAQQANAYRIYKAGTQQLYPADELPIAQALQGKAIYLDDLEIRLRNVNIPLEVRAIPVVDNTGTIVYAIQTFQNVTSRKQAELAKQRSELRMQRLTDNVPGIIFRYVIQPDGQERFTYLNPRCQEIIGVSPEAAIADPTLIWSMIVPEDEVEMRRTLVQKSASLSPWVLEYRIRQAGGQIIWLQTQASPMQGERGEIIWDGVSLDITERKEAENVLSDYRHHLEEQVQERTLALQQANQELERLATLDGLTHIANRRRFDLYLEQEWQRSARDQQPLSIILCDVDYFKRYNDCYGHQAGDYCLQLVAKGMSNTIKRPADLLARYGGEEFVVLLPNTNQLGAMQVAEDLRLGVERLKLGHEESAISDYVSISVGVATIFPIAENSPNRLIELADRALYQAKQQGRNRVCSADMILSQWN